MSQIHPARILVVDDDPNNIEILGDIFEDDHEVAFATHGEMALEIARNTSPDVILLDVMMPGMDGFEVCRRLKADRRTADICVIFVTGAGDTEAETRGLELGAADYVQKPINPPVVRLRVNNQIELKRARDQLTALATTDGLTRIANRRHFDQTLVEEYSRHVRSGAPLSLIMLDIDHFKPYNDNYGHMQGDDCLRAVAQIIHRTLQRPSDLASRYGGEEFACILPETDAEGAFAIAERIRENIEGLGIGHAHSPTATHISASLGIVTMVCQQGKSPLMLVASADEALYRAKAEGRNRVCAMTPS